MDTDEFHKEVFDELWDDSTYWSRKRYAEWKKMTVNQLKALLKENNLPVSGNKRELIERLYDNEELVKWGKSSPDVVWIPKTERARRRAKDQAELDARKTNTWRDYDTRPYPSSNSVTMHVYADGWLFWVWFLPIAAVFGLAGFILWQIIVWIADF